MNGHTKGRVKATGNGVHTADGRCVATTDMQPKEQRDADAAFIAEAFNVADETGRTPAQLATERAELVAALEKVMQFIPDLLGEAGLTEEDEDWVGQLRAILAKVKGSVQ